MKNNLNNNNNNLNGNSNNNNSINININNQQENNHLINKDINKNNNNFIFNSNNYNSDINGNNNEINNQINNNIQNNNTKNSNFKYNNSKPLNKNNNINNNVINNKNINLNNNVSSKMSHNEQSKDNKQQNNNNNFNPEQKNPIKVKQRVVQRLKEDFKNKSVNVNQFNSKTVIKKKQPKKSPFRLKETEEQRIKREKEEKEQKDIRDRLQCYLCFGKAIKARMCRNCQKIACDNCVRNMLLKTGKCGNCQKKSILDEDIVSLPFMEDLTSYFINNVENYENQKLKNINNEEEDIKEDFNNNENIINGRNNLNDNYLNEENEDVQYCDTHKDKKIEYCCIQCNVFFCSKCLMFTNQEVIEAHKNHKILEIDKLKKYNINEAIKEYQKLKKSQNNYDEIIKQYNHLISDIKVKKIRILDILENIKKEAEKKFDNQINDLNNLKSKISTDRKDIENAIDSVPNSFNNIIERNDFGQGEEILEELQKLSKKFDLKQYYNSALNIKNNLCCEWFESDLIKFDFELPQVDYIEEIILFEKELDIIKDHEAKLKLQLLGGNFIFVLSIKIDKEYYNKHLPNFYAHMVFINQEKAYIYCVFYGNVYTDGVQILTAELNYEDFKRKLDSLEMKLNVIKSYYK
jgi:hypothetical protein